MIDEITETAEESKETQVKQVWFSIIGVLIIYGIILVFANSVLARIVKSDVLNNNPYLYHINLFVILMIFFILIVPFLFSIPEKKLSFRRYFKQIRLSNIKPIIAILGLGIATSLVYLLFLYLSTLVSAKILQGEFFFDLRYLWVDAGFSEYIYRALIPGIWEEVAFRGIVLVLLLKIYSERTSIIINSVSFGLFHLINLVNMRSSPTPEVVAINVTFQVIYTTAAGFVFAYLFVKTNSLIPSILSHYLIDALGPFLQVILFGAPISLANVAIVRTSQTILGIGIIPSLANVLLIFLVYKLWKKKPFLEENNSLEKDSTL